MTALPQKSGLTRSALKRGKKWINQKGPKTTLWEDFRAKKANNDRNREGLIACEDWKIGLPPCGLSSGSPDLHHIFGREDRPDLYFAEPNLVWLIRACHDKAHDFYTAKSSTKAQDDAQRQVEATPQRDALLGVQGPAEPVGARQPRRTVYSSVQSRHAPILERNTEAGI